MHPFVLLESRKSSIPMWQEVGSSTKNCRSQLHTPHMMCDKHSRDIVLMHLSAPKPGPNYSAIRASRTGTMTSSAALQTKGRLADRMFSFLFTTTDYPSETDKRVRAHYYPPHAPGQSRTDIPSTTHPRTHANVHDMSRDCS